MRRVELATAIAAAAPGHVVLTSLGSAARAWREVAAPNPTYYGSDPMGAALGMAVGAAIARPDLDFLLLQGDGDLTMNLGALLALAGAAPANLRVIVFANGRYETGGGQPLAGNARTDLAAIGSGTGLAWAGRLEGDLDGAQLHARVEQFVREAPAPALLVAEVDEEASPYGGPGEDSGVEARVRFVQQLTEWSSRTEEVQ